MKRKVAFAGTLAVALVGVPLAAQFAVIDVASISHLIAQAATLTQQLNRMEMTYNQITNQYNQAVYMAKHLNSMATYRALMQPWLGMQAQTTYGTTAPWIQSINNGLNVVNGWTSSSIPLVIYKALNNPRLQNHYDTLQLMDGSGSSVMSTIGTVRANGTTQQTALASLENDVDDMSDDMNTEAAQLNKMNAIGMWQAHNASDANKMLVNLTEQAALQSKLQRDVAAAQVQDFSDLQNLGPAQLSNLNGGFSNAMMAYRIP